MLGLILVTIIWGSGFVVSEIALNTLTPFQILTGRFLIATLLLLPIAAKSFKGIKRGEVRAGLILGLFLFAAFALQTIGLKYTTPAKNAFLTATNVVFVPFIAFAIYRRKVSPATIIGALMALIGAAVLSLNADFSLGIGDGLTLLCAVCFAFQIFLTGEYVKQYRVVVLNFFQMTTAFVCSFIGLLFNNSEPLNVNLEGMLSVLYLGAISTVLCYILQTASQRYLSETKSAIILSLEAVFGTVFSIIILHERITFKMIVGCLLILSAVIISEIKPKKINWRKNDGHY